jgi:diguanylate cyclase (GGDEF)-like protein
MLSLTPKNQAAAHHRILCVDDDPRVLEGLALTLGRCFQVELAGSGMAALEILRERGDTTVIISDMQMPSMNGAQFLAASRKIAPEARRILLTGQADLASAILAVNEGGIFRFLTKPCARATLVAAVEAAMSDFDRDARERSAIRRTITRELSHDALTGLASREILLKRLEQSRGTGEPADWRDEVVFMIEISNVEEQSGGYDSKTADRLILLLARKLQEVIPTAECLARYRDATFAAVLIPTDPTNASLEALAARIVSVLEQPVEVDGALIQTSVTVGIARIPAGTLDARVAVRHAELAAREAKRYGNDPVRLFSQDSIDKTERRRETLQALRIAVSKQQLNLHYQPIIDVETKRVYSVEALARWEHAQLGLIPPTTFIPLAEETGLMVPLGEWVMNRACADGRGLNLLDPVFSRVSINVSVVQILDGRFMQVLHRAIETSGINPSALELELTESVLAEDLARVCKVLDDVRALGARVAIDDFGAGYSSLSYLTRLPVDVLKIDRSFVRDFERGGEAIIGAALSVARTLKIDAIVEGIETAAELARVRALGATKVQGYYFARSMPAANLVGWHSTFVDRLHAVAP